MRPSSSWLALPALFFCLSTFAQKTDRPLFGESPTTGIHLSTPSLVGGLDPSGVEINPATIGLLDSWSVMLHHSQLKQQGRVGGAGDGLFFGAHLPYLRFLSVGLGAQWLRPAQALGYDDSTKLSFALALSPNPNLSIGVGYHVFFTDKDPALHELDTWDMGLTVRPLEWFALGLVVHDLSSPQYNGFSLQRVYDLEFGWRPLRTDRLELGTGLRIGERRGDPTPHLRLEAEPVPGVRFFGHLEVLSQTFYRSDSSFTDVRATVGLAFNLERIQVAVSTVLGRELAASPGPLSTDDARSSFQGAEVSLRVSGARQRSMVTRQKLLVRISLEDQLTQRDLVGLVNLLHEVEDRPDVIGVLLELDGVGLGWAQAQELRAWVKRLRGGGKKIYAYLKAASAQEYYVASATDKILLDPAGGVALAGVALRSIYFRGLFDLIGASPQFIRIAEFKSAPESYTRKNASPEARGVMRSLLDELHAQLLRDLSVDRKKTEAQMNTLLDEGPFVPQRALTAGLVDKLVERGDLEGAIEDLSGAGVVSPERLKRASDRWNIYPAIAVILVEGDIVQGKSQTVPIIDRRIVGDETIMRALEWARTTSSVKAVILRVNSPGGSALASDHIWREVIRTRNVKPVIVSMGNLAASGGYYIACGGDRIFAQPATLTGSIGIFTGKFDLSGLMAKLGIGTESWVKGKHAQIDDFNRPYTDEERAFILSNLQYYYRLFLGAVGKGRGMTQDQVHEVARGRVWTGSQAMGKKLVDSTGGLIDALEEAKRRGGYPVNRPLRLVVLPKEESSLLTKAMRLLNHVQQAEPLLPPTVLRALAGVWPVLFRATSGEPLARLPYEIDP
jgi:protease IV